MSLRVKGEPMRRRRPLSTIGGFASSRLGRVWRDSRGGGSRRSSLRACGPEIVEASKKTLVRKQWRARPRAECDRPTESRCSFSRMSWIRHVGGAHRRVFTEPVARLHEKEQIRSRTGCHAI
jgi:hypothetical protein